MDGRSTRVLLASAAAALMVVSGASATPRPTASPLAHTHPRRVCTALHSSLHGPAAACDAWALAKANGTYAHVSGAVVRRHGAVVPSATPNTGASPDTDVVQPMWPAGLLNAYSLPSTTASSHAQAVGIVDAYDDPEVLYNLQEYDNYWGLGGSFSNCPAIGNASCLLVVNQDGQMLHLGPGYTPSPPFDSGWALEISLDVETVHTICRDCKIILVEANSNSADDLAAATDEAVALGATVVSDSYGVVEGGPDGLPRSAFPSLAAHYRHAGVTIVASSGDDAYAGGTQFPADVNDVVAVGGTTLTSDVDTGAYAHESAWYDPTTSPASGAGSGCSAYETAKRWQSVASGWTATGCGTRRAVADVSADADPNSGFYVWNSVSGDCIDNPYNTTDPCWWVMGGTSLAAPIIAATYALAANPSTLDTPGWLPYGHFGDLHDVTAGANGSCASTICRAATAYDGPTGMGSPNGLGAFSIGTPSITGFDPPAASAPGSSISITGSDFTGATAVTFAGMPAVSFTVDSDTRITAVPGTGDAGPIRVTTPGGTAVSPDDFSFPPTITSFTPRGGPAGTSLTITGTGFTNASGVAIGGTPASSFSVDSDSAISATVGAGTNTGYVTVDGPGGSATSSTPFYGTPTITSFTPASAGAHATVTVTGTNLTGATHVTLGGVTASFNFVSATTITLTVPGPAPTGTIAVTTPGGTATSANTFTVAPLPTITGFAPASGSVGTPVAVTGTNLLGTIGVQIGSIVTVPLSVTATQIVFAIPPGADSGTVRILNPAGSATSADTLVVTSSSPGSIMSFDPASGTTGTTVTLDGSGFTDATSVMFAGTAASSFTVVSDTSVTAVVAAGTHSGRIVVTTPAGTITSSGSFTFVPPPTIAGFAPGSGSVHSTVTLTGADLTGTTGVTVGGVSCAFSVVSSTKLTFTVPSGATTGPVTVTTATGTATSTSTFTVLSPPTISSITPLDGTVGTPVTITGTNLGGTIAVKLGSVMAVPTSVSPTQVTFSVPPGAVSGTIEILASNGSVTSADTFIVG